MGTIQPSPLFWVQNARMPCARSPFDWPMQTVSASKAASVSTVCRSSGVGAGRFARIPWDRLTGELALGQAWARVVAVLENPCEVVALQSVEHGHDGIDHTAAAGAHEG